MSTYKDLSGTTVRTPDNKPPVHGTTVTLPGGGTGTMVGGYAVKNK